MDVRKRLWAGCLSLLLLLCGCSSILERDYASVQPHTQNVVTPQEGSVLEVQNYQQLVSVVLHLVTQHKEDGVIRLYNYTGEAEQDVARACLEVAQRDPMGAFLVEDIRYDVSRIVSFYEAQLDISYLRTTEEMEEVAAVTGSSAIKLQLRDAFSNLKDHKVLYVNYYSGNEGYLSELIRQAYYDTPVSSFGQPEILIRTYPESGGTQRILEFQITYPEEHETLVVLQSELIASVNTLLRERTEWDAQSLYKVLRERVAFQPDLGGNTAYAALVEGKANAEGFALAYKLLCDRLRITCTVVQGEGEVPFWNIVTTSSGSRHVDCSAGLFGLTDLQLSEQTGYLWDGPYPLCRDGAELLPLESKKQ